MFEFWRSPVHKNNPHTFNHIVLSVRVIYYDYSQFITLVMQFNYLWLVIYIIWKLYVISLTVLTYTSNLKQSSPVCKINITYTCEKLIITKINTYDIFCFRIQIKMFLNLHPSSQFPPYQSKFYKIWLDKTNNILSSVSWNSCLLLTLSICIPPTTSVT